MGLELSTDPNRLNIDWLHHVLSEESYWATGSPRFLVERSIEHSLCFGLYLDGKQVGFARVISDYATFAYLSDVFVDAGHRGRGYSKVMMQAIVDHPKLQGLRLWLLGTRDAHGLYEQFGFAPTLPGRFMERRDPNPLAREE